MTSKTASLSFSTLAKLSPGAVVKIRAGREKWRYAKVMRVDKNKNSPSVTLLDEYLGGVDHTWVITPENLSYGMTIRTTNRKEVTGRVWSNM